MAQCYDSKFQVSRRTWKLQKLSFSARKRPMATFMVYLEERRSSNSLPPYGCVVAASPPPLLMSETPELQISSMHRFLKCPCMASCRVKSQPNDDPFQQLDSKLKDQIKMTQMTFGSLLRPRLTVGSRSLESGLVLSLF